MNGDAMTESVDAESVAFLNIYPSLAVSCGPVTLRVPTLADAVEMARVAYRGLFPDGASSIGDWYDREDPTANARSVLSYQFLSWKGLPGPPLRMPFAVVHENTAVGTQSLDDVTGDFLVTREIGTGSWLDPERRGQGVGTYARWAVLAFGFQVLGAETMVSSALLGNEASNAVSRKCGYREDGVMVQKWGGRRTVLQRYRLERQDWERRERPVVEMQGCEEIAELFR